MWIWTCSRQHWPWPLANSGPSTLGTPRPFLNWTVFPIQSDSVLERKARQVNGKRLWVVGINYCLFRSWTLIILHWHFDASLAFIFWLCVAFQDNLLLLLLLLQMWHHQTCLRFIQKMKSLELAAMSHSGVLCQRHKTSPGCLWGALTSPMLKTARSAARNLPWLSSQTKRRLVAALMSGVIRRRKITRHALILDVSRFIYFQ